MDGLIYYGQKMVEEGLSFATGGNLSRRLDGETYKITPSGQAYASLKDQDLVTMNLEGKILQGKKPSTEYHFHQGIYRAYPEAKAVVHTHSEYINILSILDKPLACIHYLMAEAGPDPIEVAPYASFGTEDLARNALGAFGRNKAVILSHHGLVTFGSSVKEAFSQARTLEFCAKIYIKALSVGNPSSLSIEEMEKMVDRFKSYGK